MQKATSTAYWKSRGNTWKTNFNAIESGRMCKNATITTYWKSSESESMRKIYSLSTKETMTANGKNHNYSLLNKHPVHQEHYHYGNYDSICSDIPTISFKRNDNICKIGSIEQWSPVVCGKPLLFHIEKGS